MNVGSNAVNAWWSILFYGASMAPWFNVRKLLTIPTEYRKCRAHIDILEQHGMWAMIACSIALAIWCAALSWFHHRDDVRRSLNGINRDGVGSQDLTETHHEPNKVV